MSNTGDEPLSFAHTIWIAYPDLFERESVSARSVLLKEGEVSQKMYLIEKGCIRVWHNNDGKEVTAQFFFEGHSVSSIESFRKDIPSPITIETIEHCELQTINKNALWKILNELMEKPVFRDALFDTLFKRTYDYIKQFSTFIRDTPEQRYEHLLKERPEIAKRVPQHFIASYLGITSVHLSRIKNKIVRQRRAI